jgi:tetratricopeptide (TPR) repeat protein
MAADVFISYNSLDRTFAEDLHRRLEEAGITAWLDRKRLAPGAHLGRAVTAGCDTARIILPVITPHWTESIWTRYETYGAEHVIPLWFAGEGKFQDFAPAPLRAYLALDFRSGFDSEWQRLVDAIREHLASEPLERKNRRQFVPFSHNPHFVGREKQLNEIHEALHEARATALTQASPHAVTGLGGVGKTTLAREYAEKFWRAYHDILWVTATDETAIVSAYARLAVDIGLIRESSQDINEDARRTLDELNRNTQGRERLLILDNAHDEVTIQKWIPSGSCRTLITSRFTGWSAAVQGIDVDVLDGGAARELLLRRSGLSGTEENCSGADAVAEELGYLPLALEQAAAYVGQTKITFGIYLDEYEQFHNTLLDEHALGATQYPFSVAKTWLMTIQCISDVGQAILTMSAFLAPDHIPRSMVYQASLLPKIDIDKAFRELSDYSLVRLEPDAYSVHRLIQTVQRHSLGNEATRRAWVEETTKLLNRSYPEDAYIGASLLNLLFPHWLACAKYASEHHLVSERAGALFAQAGDFLHQRGAYAAAESLFVVAAEIAESALGPEHPDVGRCLNNLGAIRHNRGDYATAVALHKRALGIREKALGPEHPDTGVSLGNLGNVYRDQGAYDIARPLLERALIILQKAFGVNHPHVAAAIDNLAQLHHSIRDYEAAEEFYKQALDVRQRLLGSEHPSTAITLNNLAELCQERRDYTAAVQYAKEALAIRERALGADHFEVAYSLNTLAGIYSNQGSYTVAEFLYKKALMIKRNTVGVWHKSYAVSLHDLAELYRRQRKYSQAEPLICQAVEIYHTVLERGHPETIAMMRRCSGILRAMDRMDEAVEMDARAREGEANYARENSTPS